MEKSVLVFFLRYFGLNIFETSVKIFFIFYIYYISYISKVFFTLATLIKFYAVIANFCKKFNMYHFFFGYILLIFFNAELVALISILFILSK